MVGCKGTLSWFTDYLSRYKQRKGRNLSNSQQLKVEMLAYQDWEISYHRENLIKRSLY